MTYQLDVNILIKLRCITSELRKEPMRLMKYPKFISLTQQLFLRFFTRTTPVKTGAQGMIQGGYSIHTPYIVL